MPAAPLRILETLRQNGHEAFFVGGCVRDLLLGRKPKDWDIATDALPDRIESLFPKTIAIGKAFGIIAVVPAEGAPVEVATYRADSPYADGRHPGAIAFTNAREDALRRDFTVNALFLDPATGEIRDFVHGRADLDAHLIRAIGDPSVRFAEDHLRMLRAIRFASTLGFAIEPATFSAIQTLAPQIHRISAERIRDELFRLLTESPHAGEALQLLRDSGLLKEVLPEIDAMAGVEQPPEFHPEGDVFTHTRLMLDAMPPHPSLRLALSVLLHDVGKPPTAQFATMPDGTQRWRFECHASVGADMARAILERLRSPNALIDDVCAIIAGHMRLAEAPKMRESKLRRLLGAPTFDDELELHRLDCLSSHSILDVYDFLKAEKSKFAAEPVLPPPLVTGRDLIALGHKPGPHFSKILQDAYDRQLEGQTDKAALLAILPAAKT
ncbi:MAG TPA: phosphohydrolase [Verrucomicrobia bacterium]|nr:phosphohydrolase [Verrucomicrobiota bacterium]